jgi:tetratricopeptide (TPR) repeat protein
MDIMTAKFLRIPASLLAVTMAITLGAGLSRAGRQPNSTAQEKDKDKGKDKGEKKEKVNKAEEAAYKAFFDARTGDPATQIQLGEDFATKFPQSHYLNGVYGTLTSAYYNTGNTDKMFATGTKALELDPDNVDVLSLLAMAIPRRVHATTPDGAQQLQKAEVYAHHAIELIPNLPKPAEVDDATFEKAKNDKLSLAHSGLGLIYVNHSKFDDARTELTQAVQLATTPDQVDYFLLGNADVGASYYHDAVAAYQKCADSGPLAAQCKARMASAQHDAETKLGR